jgi:hypothetical protein
MKRKRSLLLFGILLIAAVASLSSAADQIPDDSKQIVRSNPSFHIPDRKQSEEAT